MSAQGSAGFVPLQSVKSAELTPTSHALQVKNGEDAQEGAQAPDLSLAESKDSLLSADAKDALSDQLKDPLAQAKGS